MIEFLLNFFFRSLKTYRLILVICGENVLAYKMKRNAEKRIVLIAFFSTSLSLLPRFQPLPLPSLASHSNSIPLTCLPPLSVLSFFSPFLLLPTLSAFPLFVLFPTFSPSILERNRLRTTDLFMCVHLCSIRSST